MRLNRRDTIKVLFICIAVWTASWCAFMETQLPSISFATTPFFLDDDYSVPQDMTEIQAPEQPLKVLFIHQNFPGQFLFLSQELARLGHNVTALHMRDGLKGHDTWNGVRLFYYQAGQHSTKGIHRYVSDMETKVIRGEANMKASMKLRDEWGFYPDVIIAHPGWGESLFIKQVFPKARLGLYCELHYQEEHSRFDSEFADNKTYEEFSAALSMRNLNNYVHYQFADAGISPTYFQANTFPEPMRSRISVIFDGVDTKALSPNLNATISMNTHTGLSLQLTTSSEVITFINRNLEPYRGYHIFMRALPEILKTRPNARVVLIGGNSVSYGSAPDPKLYNGTNSWKDIFYNEIKSQLSEDDLHRVHFVGKVSHDILVSLLQLTTVRVYLTYPFVLSWSVMESMSIGSAIVASDTAPLREVILNNITGVLVDFFDHRALANEVVRLLANPKERARLGANAQKFARHYYDLHSVCLPRQLQWVYSLAQM